MIRNINDRGPRGSQKQGGWRFLTNGALLGVALSAFVFLGWLPGTAALFSGFGPALAEFRPYTDVADLQVLAKNTQRDPVAAILSHWEYTDHCITGIPNTNGCPGSCSSCNGVDFTGIPPGCCTTCLTNSNSCGTDTPGTGNQCCGCCPIHDY